MSLKALLALRPGDTRYGVISRSSRQTWPLYGTQKVAKTQLTAVLDMQVLELYDRLVALASPRSRSMHRLSETNGAPQTQRAVHCLPPDGTSREPAIGDSHI